MSVLPHIKCLENPHYISDKVKLLFLFHFIFSQFKLFSIFSFLFCFFQKIQYTTVKGFCDADILSSRPGVQIFP